MLACITRCFNHKRNKNNEIVEFHKVSIISLSSSNNSEERYSYFINQRLSSQGSKTNKKNENSHDQQI